MASSTSEADIEAQTSVVTALPANNAGASSTDITPNPQHSPNHDLQVTNTNDPSNAQTTKNLEVQRDENHGDSSDGLWSMYLTEAEKQDKEVTESWKGDTDGILVFTGLFSATVATFITESLQNLTPDPIDQTNALLTQISQQLFNISNGTPLTSAAAQISQSFTPTPSAVRVNILWFLSLVLSLSCALSATLMQQWARRYQELAQRRGAFHRRGRMRAYIFDGIKRFKMARVVAAMPKLLHISVFLFFAGVVDFLFPIYPAIAYATLGCIMAFTLPYAIFTVLPNIHFNCPYGTPLSSITWRIFQLSVIIYLQIILEIRKSFSRTWSLANRHAHESQWLKKWQQTLENQVKIRRQWFSQGLLRSVELSAYRADSTVVTNALAWTLTALDEDKEIEDFAARVPGFFNSRVVPDATSAVLSLMSHEPTADPIFGSRLYDLLKTCLPETSVLDEKMRKNRLRVCLNCLWHFGRAYNQPAIYEPLPSYFSNALVPEITHRVQIEEDSGVRVMGHCFEALIVKKLAADLDSIKDVELACLSAILGIKSHDMALYLSQPDTVSLANVISFSFEKIGTMIPTTVPSDVLDMVQQTLDILSQPMSTSTTKSAGLQFDQPIPIISGSNGKFESILLSRLRDLLNTCLLATMPHRPERTSRLRLCLMGLWYFGRAFNLLGIDLPSDIYIAFLNSEVTLTQSHSDATVRAIGHCAMSLVVNKLAADIDARTLPINDVELACLSAILNTDSQGVIYVLNHPGAFQLASMSLLMSDTIDDTILWDPTSNALPAIQQTFSILSQALPAQLDAEMRLDLTDTLIDMAKGSPPSDIMCNRVFGMFLRNLWHFTRLRNESGDSTPLPSYLYVSFSHPGITRFILEKGDITARVIRYCVGALITNNIATDINARTLPVNDAELECLAVILDTTNQDVIKLLSHSGAIQFLNMVCLIENVYEHPSWDPSIAPDIVRRTFDVLTQSLPAQLDAEIQLDLTDTLTEVSEVASSRSHVMRGRVLGMFLKNLWHFTRLRIENRDSIPLPSYVYIFLAHPRISCFILEKGDIAACIIRRCIGALIINKIATDINATLPVNDMELEYLAAVLDTTYQDVTNLLIYPGAIQFVNMVYLMEYIYKYPTWSPSIAPDIVRRTFDILTQSLPAQLDTEIRLDLTDTLAEVSEVTSSRSHVMRSKILNMLLKNLWHFTRLRLESGDSIPLPSYLYVSFSHPRVTRFILKGGITAHVIRHCVGALIIHKLSIDIGARTLPINDAELECLTAVLDTTNQDVTNLLSHPGAIQFVNIVRLIEDIYEHPSLSPSIEPGVIRRTFDTLTQSLLGQLDTEIQLDLTDTLAEVSEVTSSRSHVMRGRVLDMFLKNLWHFTRLRIESGDSIPLPSYLYVSFSHPRVTRFILEKGDITARVIRRCVGALIIIKLSIDISARTLPINDAELDFLTSILDITNQDVTNLLSHPGAVQFTNMVYFMWDTIYDALFCTPTSHVLDVAQQTFNLLSQAVPAPLNAHMRLDLSETLMDVSNGTSCQTPSEVTRSGVLGMFLKNLWHFTRSYTERWNSIPLPSYFYIAFTHAGVTRRIYGGDNMTAHVTGRCIGALVVNKLVADIKSGTITVKDAEIECLSAILHSESRDVKLCLTQPGIVELVNLASLVLLGHVDSFKASDVLLDLHEVLQQTLGILSHAVPPQENTEIHPDQAGVLSHIFDDGLERIIVSRLHGLLTTCISDTSPLAEELRASCLRMCLKTLWLSSKSYHRTSKTLPHYFPLMLASPEMIHNFQTEQDPVVRLTGCCFGALIASKLIDILYSEIYISLAYDQGAWTCISAILGTGRDASLASHVLRIINFQKVVSFFSGEIDTLFNDSERMPVDMLQRYMLLVDTTKVTLRTLADRLCDGRFIPRWLPMYERQLLQETFSGIEDAFDLPHGSKYETVNALDGLQQKLDRLRPAVG